MHPIVIEALLVNGPPGRVRLIVDTLMLELAAEDVLDVEELPAPAGLILGSALPAKLTIESGARLMRLASAEAYRPLIWNSRVSFTLATRRDFVHYHEEKMTEAENQFFAARGLLESVR